MTSTPPKKYFSPNRPVETKLSLEESLIKIEQEFEIATSLHYWFKHDTWSVQEGLMLLAGFSPKTIFEERVSTSGEKLRSVRVFIRANGFESDPDLGNQLLGPLEMYERIWKSGEHPEKSKPEYYLSWAQRKGIPPLWLGWAIDNGYYADSTTVDSTEEQLNKKLESTYIHLIGALCQLLWQKKEPDKIKINISKIIEDLAIYKGFPGLSERNLKDKLPKCIKAIQSS